MFGRRLSMHATSAFCIVLLTAEYYFGASFPEAKFLSACILAAQSPNCLRLSLDKH
jgi:hypothetical protein